MKIAVVGGGFTGLTAAYELLKYGHTVTLFEKESVLGGLAIGWKEKGWSWSLEKGYHHWFTNDDAIFGLIDELGLKDKLIVKRPITSIWWNGQIYPFDSPSTLLSFPGLGLLDKMRTAILMAGLKLNPTGTPLEGMTAEHLFRSIGGDNAFKTIWEPLIYGKFSHYAPRVAASWLWARIKKRTQSLAYMQGGFQTVIDTLEKSVTTKGGIIKKGIAVSQKDLSKFDRVLLTVPTPIAAKLIEFPASYIQKPLTIPHLHAQVLVLETKEPIVHDIYWLNVTDRSFPFLAVVAHTNFMDKKHYGGKHITYIGNYLPPDHKYLSMTKEQLIKEFLPFVQQISPETKIKILNSHLFVAPFAQPVHELHYSKKAPKLKTPIPGVYLANLDSIYPWDRGTNYAVELGIRSAQTIHENG